MPTLDEFLASAVHVAQTCACLHTMNNLRQASLEVCLADDMVRMHGYFKESVLRRGPLASSHSYGKTLLEDMPETLKQAKDFRDDTLYRLDESMKTSLQTYLSRFAYHLGDEIAKVGREGGLSVLTEHSPQQVNIDFSKRLSVCAVLVSPGEASAHKRIGNNVTDYPYIRLDAEASPTEGKLILSWNKKDKKRKEKQVDTYTADMALMDRKIGESTFFTPSQINEIIYLVQRNTAPLFRYPSAPAKTNG